MECEECGEEARYLLEWWGLNQHGENPEIADEIYVCSNPEHIIKEAHHPDYGGCPDAVCDALNGKEESPELLELIIKAMDNPTPENISAIEAFVMGTSPIGKRQLELFPGRSAGVYQKELRY